MKYAIRIIIAIYYVVPVCLQFVLGFLLLFPWAGGIAYYSIRRDHAMERTWNDRLMGKVEKLTDPLFNLYDFIIYGG